MNTLLTLEEAAAAIANGRPLLIAGTEALLAKLPRGRWIAGTIPYFMGPDGGVVTHDRLFVTSLPDVVLDARVASYDAQTLPRIADEAAAVDVTFVVLPGFSEVHHAYARDGQSWPRLFDRPIVGWIAGFDLGGPGGARAKVMDGATGALFEDRAVALHARLADGHAAFVDIVNIFEQGQGPVIRFPEGGFSVSGCTVDGKPENFARWVAEQKVDTQLPLVADYNGAFVNVSFQDVDAAAGTVKFYAPVFPHMEYRLARPVADYAQAFAKALDARSVSPVFACNCILNFLYGKLEGRRTGQLVGPITFGEVAYMLLNQTAVYVDFRRA